MAGPCAEGREVWSCLDGLDEDSSSAPEMGPTLGTSLGLPGVLPCL